MFTRSNTGEDIISVLVQRVQARQASKNNLYRVIIMIIIISSIILVLVLVLLNLNSVLYNGHIRYGVNVRTS